MIETCTLCGGTGIYFQRVYSDFDDPDFMFKVPDLSKPPTQSHWKETQVPCPHCHGLGKHRTGEWTPLKSIPQLVLYELVKLKALVQEDIGKVTFVANQADLGRMKDDELLTLLADCTRVGKLMEDQNWLVIY